MRERSGLEVLGPDFQICGSDIPRCLFHADGVFALTLGDERVIVAGVHPRMLLGRSSSNAIILFGRTRAALVGFLRRVLNARHISRVRVWGGPLRHATPPTVAENDIILPATIQVALLAWLDRFWRLRDKAVEHKLPLHRGLLLVGPPGTGKTNFVRHLLTRYPDVPAHLFVAARQGVREDPFGEMLATVQGAGQGAMVILEDIDRMAESGMVTKEYLLNCLDGFLELPVPLLWVATSNDPTLLERSLLQRPGRFDRTVVFPLPAAQERGALIRRFTTMNLKEDELDQAVVASAGLTGAHLREACASATLASLETDAPYGKLLKDEIELLRRQHADAEYLERGLRTRVQGLAPAPQALRE
jgi:hypothetical protein